MRAILFAVLIFFGLFALQWGATKVHARKNPLPAPAVDAPLASAPGQQTAVLAGGCFWGIQGLFEHVKGVTQVTAGYSGGEAGTARYDLVSTGVTGHSESVKIVYDPSQISYGQLLMIYFSVGHDPTEFNRQGPDSGPQYRSSIFFATPEQRRIANAYIAQLNAAKVFSDKIVTDVYPFDAFYPAEAYHQDYLKRHPRDSYIVAYDLPKIESLKKEFPGLYHD